MTYKLSTLTPNFERDKRNGHRKKISETTKFNRAFHSSNQAIAQHSISPSKTPGYRPIAQYSISPSQPHLPVHTPTQKKSFARSSNGAASAAAAVSWSKRCTGVPCTRFGEPGRLPLLAPIVAPPLAGRLVLVRNSLAALSNTLDF